MKLKQAGFAHIGLTVLAVIVIMVIAFAAGRVSNNNSSSDATSMDSQQEERLKSDTQHNDNIVGETPVFERLPFDSKQLDCSPMVSPPPEGAYCVLVFNAGKRHNDHSFRTSPNTKIYSGISGVVSVLEYQEDSDDYAVHIIPGVDSFDKQTQAPAYIVEYDHFWKPKIKVGSVVTPDTVIGTVPCASPARARKTGDQCLYYRFELQVNEAYKNELNQDGWPINYNVCAYNFFPRGLQAQLKSMLAKHNAAFPSNTLNKFCTGEKIPA